MARMILRTSYDLDQVVHVDTYSGGGFKGAAEQAHAIASSSAPLDNRLELLRSLAGVEPGDGARLILDRGSEIDPAHVLTLGTSVGALVGACKATGKLEVLHELWAGVDDATPWNGIRGFLRAAFLRGGGLFSLKPIQDLLRRHIHPEDLRGPFGVGVTVRETGKHHTVVFGPDSNPEELRTFILGSAAIAFLMDPWVWGALLDEDKAAGVGTWTLSDGGHAHLIPLPDLGDLPALRSMDAVYCSPLDKRPTVSEWGLWRSFWWLVEMGVSAPVGNGLDALRQFAGAGVKVTRYAPEDAHGHLLRADRETIAKRNLEGVKLLERPSPVRGTR